MFWLWVTISQVVRGGKKKSQSCTQRLGPRRLVRQDSPPGRFGTKSRLTVCLSPPSWQMKHEYLLGCTCTLACNHTHVHIHVARQYFSFNFDQNFSLRFPLLLPNVPFEGSQIKYLLPLSQFETFSEDLTFRVTFVWGAMTFACLETEMNFKAGELVQHKWITKASLFLYACFIRKVEENVCYFWICI